MTYPDYKTDHIQGVTPPVTEWGKNYAKMEHARIGLVQVGARMIWVKDLAQCWVCGKEFLAEPYQYYCSDSCQDQGDNEADNWRSE